jgi:hypothetical protein
MNNATLVYEVDPSGGQTPAAIATAMGVVPIPLDVLTGLGLRVTSTGVPVPVATPVKRTIVVAFGPSVTGTAVAVLGEPGESGHPVDHVTVTATGIDYVVPPQVELPLDPTDLNVTLIPTARAFLDVQDKTLVSGGAGYAASTTANFVGAMSPPTFADDGNFTVPSCVQAVNVANQGRGYTPATTSIEFVGTLDPTDPLARVAMAVVSAFGPHGEIKSVMVVDPGRGYLNVPKIKVVDPTGADNRSVEAHLAAQMGAGIPASISLTIVLGVITVATVTSTGARYIGVPSVVVFDPTGGGSGAVILARMGVGSVEMISSGKGLTIAPVVTLLPFFKAQYPDSSDQRAPFWRLMEPAFATMVVTPVKSDPPALS